MASFIISPTFLLPRWQSKSPILITPSFARLNDFKSRKACWFLRAVSKKKTVESGVEDVGNVGDTEVENSVKISKKAPRKSKKKTTLETQQDPSASAIVSDVAEDDDTKTTAKRTRKKAATSILGSDGETSEKKVTRRKSKKKSDEGSDAEVSDNEEPVKKVRQRKSKKKIENMDDQGIDVDLSDDEEPVKVSRRKTKSKIVDTDAQGSDVELNDDEETVKKVSRKKSTKKIDNLDDEGSDAEFSDHEDITFTANIDDDDEGDLDIPRGEEDDISFSYSWPPLVCCYGAAQHAFIPSGRPANRLIDQKIHERLKDALWAPEKFVRAPGSSASSVSVALAKLGGRVEFMGKLGDDEYGKGMLYYLNMHNVQTRSINVDSKRLTAVSHMKISKKGRLRGMCVKPCAEDSLSKSEINIDVLKEAKMFYFNSSSLLDKDMRSTTLRAIRIARKLGSDIFFDLNLPLPLWKSNEETKMFIQQAWNLSDIIEVTKQELEFLRGMKPLEKFDTKDNDKIKFAHHKQDMVMPLWHENLKVLFVTNGTSKIHYYTKDNNGSVHGMEDPPITPFTCDMSESGDGIVAGLMRMLAVQPHLMTDTGYLESTISYAIDCGVIDQWLLARTRGFPPKEDMDEDLCTDENGTRSITHRQYRTLEPASS
ncbi:fructokinase-like 2, chloroplastic [Papaver somniferum]|uniref:fructokinase-like 2, chloroplastic n=1 Tax=Papaver somniferum TaxID=3469 RepID=UPI000E6F6B0D|nr:fructokinase-like 2, chloroplastic [Papaver somniferum]